jgi:hypothetical protein
MVLKSTDPAPEPVMSRLKHSLSRPRLTICRSKFRRRLATRMRSRNLAQWIWSLV